MTRIFLFFYLIISFPTVTLAQFNTSAMFIEVLSRLQFGTATHPGNIDYVPYSALAITDPEITAQLTYETVGPLAYKFIQTRYQQQALCQKPFERLLADTKTSSLKVWSQDFAVAQLIENSFQLICKVWVIDPQSTPLTELREFLPKGKLISKNHVDVNLHIWGGVNEENSPFLGVCIEESAEGKVVKLAAKSHLGAEQISNIDISARNWEDSESWFVERVDSDNYATIGIRLPFEFQFGYVNDEKMEHPWRYSGKGYIDYVWSAPENQRLRINTALIDRTHHGDGFWSIGNDTEPLETAFASEPDFLIQEKASD